MKAFDELREVYYRTDGSRPSDAEIKKIYTNSAIKREFQAVLSSCNMVYHLDREKKTLIFKSEGGDIGLFVAISSEASNLDIRKYTVILAECAGEYYEHQDFHKAITGLDGDKFIQYAIKKYQIPITSYFDLSKADVFRFESSK